MGDDFPARSFHHYLRIRCVAYLIAFDGRLELKDMRTFARKHGIDTGSVRRPDGSSDGSIAGRAVNRAMSYLYDEGLVTRVGAEIVAPDVAELAAWLADEIELDGEPYEPPPPGPPPARIQRLDPRPCLIREMEADHA